MQCNPAPFRIHYNKLVKDFFNKCYPDPDGSTYKLLTLLLFSYKTLTLDHAITRYMHHTYSTSISITQACTQTRTVNKQTRTCACACVDLWAFSSVYTKSSSSTLQLHGSIDRSPLPPMHACTYVRSAAITPRAPLLRRNPSRSAPSPFSPFSFSSWRQVWPWPWCSSRWPSCVWFFSSS